MEKTVLWSQEHEVAVSLQGEKLTMNLQWQTALSLFQEILKEKSSLVRLL